jgi:iron complex outermembrane recepter protein
MACLSRFLVCCTCAFLALPWTLAVATDLSVPQRELSSGMVADALTQALSAFAQQTGLQLIYVSQLAEGRRSQAVPAGLLPAAALARLLVGTGLDFRFINGRTVEIFAVPKRAAPGREQPARGASETENLEEIVVTAQRREEAMVDVPITIAAIDTQQLATANVQDLRDIAQLTPSLRFDNNAGFFQPSIRGIGTGVTTSGGGSNVGIYIDGFYSPNPLAADCQLLNVSSVQVLKGPQGTLFGHNTTGGAILVTTVEPTQETHAQGTLDYGSFNAQRYQAYASTGLVGGLAANIGGILAKGHGFLTDIVDNNDHVGDYENWTVRTGLKWQVTDGLSALVRYTHSKSDDPNPGLGNSNIDSSINPTTGQPWGIQTFTVPGTFTTNPNDVALRLPAFIRTNTDIAQLTVKADLGSTNLTSYSQWRQEDTDQSINQNFVAIPDSLQLGLPIFDSTYTLELLLSSKPGTRLQWTTGVFLFSDRDTYIVDIDAFENLPLATIESFGVPVLPNGRIPSGGNSTTTRSYAYYLDATYELMRSKLYFTAGARLSHDIVDDAYYDVGFVLPLTRIPIPSINSNKVTPRAVIRYKPADRSSVYASFSEGYKAPIIDAGGSCQNAPLICNPVQAEDLYAYEIGYKFETPNFSNEVAAYDYQYRNLQVSEYLGLATADIVNAAQSRIYGLEDEFHFNFEDHFQVNGGVAWTHARYTTFGGPLLGQIVGAPVYATCPNAVVAGCTFPVNYDYVPATTHILHGAHMQHVPDYTANLGPRYTTGMTATGEYSVSGNAYFSSYSYNSPAGTQFRQPSYTTLALRTEWNDPSERYTVALYGNNVTNVRYRTSIQVTGNGVGATWNAPITWGVEFGVKL